jgi:hypothetical protein
MAVKTITELKELWIDGFIPDQNDYIDLFDTMESMGANSGLEFMDSIPVKTGVLGDKEIYRFIQLVENPSFQDVIQMPIPEGAEIMSFSAKYRQDTEPHGEYINIEAETVETPQNRFNLRVTDVTYIDDTAMPVSVASFKAHLVEEIEGGNTYTLNWEGTPVTLNIDTSYAKSFRVKPKKVELTPNDYRLAQQDDTSYLNMNTSVGAANGKVRYDKFQSVTRRKIFDLPLIADTQGYYVETKNLYADTERLFISCEYLLAPVRVKSKSK